MRTFDASERPARTAARWRGRLRLVLIGVLALAWLAGAGASAPPGAAAGPAPAAAIGGCQVFPADNVWNARIDSLPVHPQSNAWVQSIGPSTGLKADFGSGLWEDAPIGIPYTTVPGSQPPVSIDFYYPRESDPGPYRIPPDAPIEGGSDDHVLVIDRDRCLLAEVYDATQSSATSWSAGSGAVFDLGSNALRPAGWTSADAAGLPILPGLVRYDEVAAGEIAHALRFTVPNTQRAYLWPARHYASSNTDPNLPPMGARFRLNASVDVSGYPAELRVILTALQRYGMFLADNGSPWYISGVPDERWDNDLLRQLRFVVGSQLEAVDESSLMVHPDSGQVRPPGPPPTAPTAPSCSPRPAARVEVTRAGAGRLDVTVTAGTDGTTPSNGLRALRFGTPNNATVILAGQAVSPNARIALPAGASQARFTVQRIQANQGATVPLVVEDACGDWPTFVGGGPAAF